MVDAFARALLAGGGDRRALAPLAAAGPDQLRGCVAVIACGLSRDAVRSLARARRPFVVALLRGDDRYAWGTLPGVGAANAIPPLADGSPDIDTALRRLAARLEPDDAVELATACRCSRRWSRPSTPPAAARWAALLALRGRSSGAITARPGPRRRHRGPGRRAPRRRRPHGRRGLRRRRRNGAARGRAHAFRRASSGPRSRTAARSSCSPAAGRTALTAGVAVYAV